MRKSILLLLAGLTTAGSCQKCPDSAKHCPNTGGSTSTGGSISTGGKTSTGGKVSTGGSNPITTGGNSSWVFVPLTCPPASKMAAKESVKYKLNWKPEPNRKRGAAVRVSATYTPTSVLWAANTNTSLDQGIIGDCTTNAGFGALSFRPFTLQSIEVWCVSAYSAATRIDNGCAWNATKCAGSYPPTDNGSYGTSALTAILDMMAAKQVPQAFTTYTTADTFTQMLSEVNTKGPCIIGSRWDNSMMSTTQSAVGCGQLNDIISSGEAGGHERAIVGLDVVMTNGQVDYNLSQVIETNSWGNTWGGCVGPRCGYQAIPFNQEEALLNDGGEIDCPNPM